VAKPYHPIFLDVLGQILRKVEETDDLDLSVAQDSDQMSEEETEALRSQRISRVVSTFPTWIMEHTLMADFASVA
jgi:hypothetical protein